MSAYSAYILAFDALQADLSLTPEQRNDKTLELMCECLKYMNDDSTLFESFDNIDIDSIKELIGMNDNNLDALFVKFSQVESYLLRIEGFSESTIGYSVQRVPLLKDQILNIRKDSEYQIETKIIRKRIDDLRGKLCNPKLRPWKKPPPSIFNTRPYKQVRDRTIGGAISIADSGIAASAPAITEIMRVTLSVTVSPFELAVFANMSQMYAGHWWFKDKQ